MNEIHPLERMTEERIDALIERDWERYAEIGNQIVAYLDERKRLKGQVIEEPSHD